MSDIVVGIKLKADGKGLVGELTNAKGEVARFGTAATTAGNKANIAGKNIGAMSIASGNLNTRLRSMVSPLGLVAGGFSALIASMGISRIIRTADEMTNLRNQLKLVTSGTEELTRTQRQLLTLSNDTRSDIGATIPLYTKLVRATRDLNVNQNQLLAVTKAVNQSFVISGASQAESAGSIRQLAQALASGAFRGDEFNSVAEQAPRLLQALGDETGKTTGELREMAAQGLLTSDLLVRALVNQSARIDSEYANMTATTGQAFTVLANNTSALIGGFDEATGASGALANGLLLVAEGVAYLENFVTSGQMLGYLDALSQQWEVWADDVLNALKTVSDGVPTEVSNLLTRFIQIDTAYRNFILSSFRQFPQNVRALIQIVAVELASLIDIGREYGAAFGRVVGVELAKLVDKAGIYGKELADIMAFWDGDTFDPTAALAQADAIARGMTNSFLAQAQKQVDVSRDARAKTLVHIVDERNAAIKSFEEQIAAANALGAAKAQAAANDSTFDNVVPFAQGQRGDSDAAPNVTDSQLEKLRESLLSQEELLALHLQKKNALLGAAYAQGKIQEDEFNSLSLAANKQYLDQLQAFNASRMNLVLSSSQQIFGALAGLAKTFGGEQSKAYKIMFATQKGFAIAQGILNLSTAISNASAIPFPANIPAMAQAAATGAALITQIKGAQYQGQAHDGLARVPASNEGTYLLRRDEMVLNPKQRENFEHVVDYSKQAGSGGAKVINLHHTLNIDATNAVPGIEQRIRSEVESGLAQSQQALYDDFSNNGPLARRLKAG